MLRGIGASEGIGIGRVLLIKEQNLSYTPFKPENSSEELVRYNNAVAVFCQNTEQKAQAVKRSAGEKEAEILNGHILMISDPYMTSEIEKKILDGMCAEQALEEVCDMFIAIFSSSGDELTMQRAADVRDIKTGVLAVLLGEEETDISLAPPGTVLVAKELTPSMTAGINKQNVVAIVTETGGKTSHSAILARALEIPAVLGITDLTTLVCEDETVIVDGSEGVLLAKPSPEEIAEYAGRREVFLKQRSALKEMIGRLTFTADGKQVELVCNIGNAEDAKKVLENDGEGVGLFRTEFLFLDQSTVPTETEQFEAYKKAALLMKGRPVIIRTLDVGGDKNIPSLHIEKEENPFLGFRAVRFCLQREEVYRPQLRALLRASAYGDIRIMIPLVTCVEEVKAVKELIKQISTQLDSEGIPYNKNIPVGVMIETPAAALIADLLAKQADFFSIGTNDLTQYTMAVDRGNAKVAYLYSHYNPAVLRSIERIIRCGTDAGISVGMCGEAASDPCMIPLLLSFGLQEFSVTPTAVLSTRKVISLWSQKEADHVAKQVMELTEEAEISSYLKFIKKS